MFNLVPIARPWRGEVAERNRVPQLVGQKANTLAGPPQGRYLVSSRQWLNEMLQSFQKARVKLSYGFPSAVKLANTICQHRLIRVQFLQAAMDSATRDTSSTSRQRVAAIAEGFCLRGCPYASRPLVKMSSQRIILPIYIFSFLHASEDTDYRK